MKRSYLVTLILTFAALSALILPAALILPGCDTLITKSDTITLTSDSLGKACLVCHTDDDDTRIIVPKGQWANSAHASIGLLEATVDVNGILMNTAVCGPVCHSGNGFVDFVENENSGTQSKPSFINCFTCHMPHSGKFGSFMTKPLRGLDTTGMILKTGSRYDLGKSNMCVICHQSPSKPVVSPITTINADFGPHFSAQADMLIGSGGFLVDSGIVKNSHLRSKITDGCLNCHFDDGVGFSFGEHTFRLEDKVSGAQFIGNCDDARCHASDNLTSLFDFPVLDAVKIMADSLQFLLTSLNVLDSTDSAGVRFNAGITVPRAVAEMLNNYLLYRMDGSRGVHNRRFADTLLRASLTIFDSIPQASFVATTDTVICAGASVVFADLSKNGNSWTWDFGDGSPSFTDSLPAPPGAGHNYTSPGIYTVSLTIDGPGGRDTVSKVNHIMVFDSVTAAFSVDTTIGPAPLTVTFTDNSLGSPTIWGWNFGDGSFSPSENIVQNPVHTYSIPGSYVVRFTALNSCNADSTVGIDTIFVQ